MSGQRVPMPAPQGLNAEFYRHCAEGELRFQRCDECGTWRHPPRVLCARCRSDRWHWDRSSGRGLLYTWTVVHQAIHPGLAEDVPYALVVVEMEEGPRVVARPRSVDLGDLEIGLVMDVGFERVSDDIALPWFEPAR